MVPSGSLWFRFVAFVFAFVFAFAFAFVFAFVFAFAFAFVFAFAFAFVFAFAFGTIAIADTFAFSSREPSQSLIHSLLPQGNQRNR